MKTTSSPSNSLPINGSMPLILHIDDGFIPFEVHRAYIDYHRVVESSFINIKKTLHESRLLFSSQAHLEEKRRILFLLAHIGSQEAYAVLQRYLEEPDAELEAWAVLALQECEQFMYV